MKRETISAQLELIYYDVIRCDLYYFMCFPSQNLRTALHYACAFGRLDVATLLTNKGADLNVQEKVS